MSEYPALECSQIVYRALLKRTWLDPDTRDIKADAFIKRPAPLDADGISVGFDISKAPKMGPITAKFGIASLHVGRVRDAGLDIVQDSKHHAAITGLPYPADDAANAERLASALARQARLTWPTPPEA